MSMLQLDSSTVSSLGGFARRGAHSVLSSSNSHHRQLHLSPTTHSNSANSNSPSASSPRFASSSSSSLDSTSTRTVVPCHVHGGRKSPAVQCATSSPATVRVHHAPLPRQLCGAASGATASQPSTQEPPLRLSFDQGTSATVRMSCHSRNPTLSAQDKDLLRKAVGEVTAQYSHAVCSCEVRGAVSPPTLRCQCTQKVQQQQQPQQPQHHNGLPGAASSIPAPSGPNADLKQRELYLESRLNEFHSRQLSAIPVANGQTGVTSQGIYADHAAVNAAQRFVLHPADPLSAILGFSPASSGPTQQQPASLRGASSQSSSSPTSPTSHSSSSSSSSASYPPPPPPLPTTSIDAYGNVADGIIKHSITAMSKAPQRRLWTVAETAGLIKLRQEYQQVAQAAGGTASSSSSSSSSSSFDHIREVADTVKADPVLAARQHDAKTTRDRQRRDLALSSARLGGLLDLKPEGSPLAAPAMTTRAGVGAAICTLFPRCLSMLGGTSLQTWVLTALRMHARHSVPDQSQCVQSGATMPPPPSSHTPSAPSKSSHAAAAAAAAAGAGAGAPPPHDSDNSDTLLAGLTGTGDWGLDSLLALRRWCVSPNPAKWLEYAAASLAKQQSPAPPSAPSSFLETSSYPHSADEILQQVHSLTAAALDAPSGSKIVIREAGSVPSTSVPAAGVAGVAGVAGASGLSADAARSVLLRLEGVFSCLCLNVGVPAAGLGASDSASSPPLPPQPSLTSNHTVDPLRGLAAVAGHTLHLPPVSDAELSSWVRQRLRESGGEDASEIARLKALYAALMKGQSSGDVSGPVLELRSEAKQLSEERKRLEELLKKRLRKLHSHLRKQVEALKDAVKRSSSALIAAQNNRKATVDSARNHRKEDLEVIEKIRQLLREMENSEPSANVVGCEGGGGQQGAELARAHAKALFELAKAQTAMDASIKADGAAPSTDKAKLHREQLSNAVRYAHLEALTASVKYEAATQRCVAHQKGEDTDAAKSEEEKAWQKAKKDPLLSGSGSGSGSAAHDSMSPLDLVAKGDISGAVASAKSAEQRLRAAKALLESKRRRWEEAVVRLARPKNCLQLLSLATEGSDGVYTIFPPDDVQYAGVQVYCDMTTKGGGWTLVGYGEQGLLGSPLGVSHGAFSPAGPRRGSANVNSLWVVTASSEVAIAWTMPSAEGKPAPPVPTGNISSYQHAIAYDIPAPESTTLAVLPAPPPQACSASSGDWVSVTTRCIVGKCDLPKKMYTSTDSLGVCSGHAYGLVLPEDPSEACDGRMPSDGESAETKGVAKAGVMIGVDGTQGCSGLLTSTGSGDGLLLPAHMAVWMR